MSSSGRCWKSYTRRCGFIAIAWTSDKGNENLRRFQKDSSLMIWGLQHLHKKFQKLARSKQFPKEFPSRMFILDAFVAWTHPHIWNLNLNGHQFYALILIRVLPLKPKKKRIRNIPKPGWRRLFSREIYVIHVSYLFWDKKKVILNKN